MVSEKTSFVEEQRIKNVKVVVITIFYLKKYLTNGNKRVFTIKYLLKMLMLDVMLKAGRCLP